MVTRDAPASRPAPSDEDLFESVEVGGSTVPIRICWGEHPNRCGIGPEGADPGHGPVVEIDYDDASHRRLLRWLRRINSTRSHVAAVPHTATLPVHDEEQYKGHSESETESES